MPRSYKRKTNRRLYSTEHLEEALERCRSGVLSIKRCSLVYGIPRQTLTDHLKGRRGKTRSNIGGYGKGTALTADAEQELAQCLKTVSSWGFGLSRTEVFNLVERYVKNNKLVTPFKNHRPGEDWWLGFKGRHKLAIKKPEPLENVRHKQASNPFVIYKFYDLLETTVKSLDLCDKPHRIWNCGKTSFSHDPSRTKVVTPIGKTCHRITAGTGRDNTTVLACVSAAGDKMPPFVIFRGKNMWDSWIPAAGTDYPNTCYVSTPKGWMTAEIFENWFKKQFLMLIGEDRPVMLIFDGHVSHVSPQLINCAIQNNITILKLPAHTSHILQPLDVSCFRGLKIKWDNNLTVWQRGNVGMRPSKAAFGKILGKAWLALTKEVIINGFKATGIFDSSVVGYVKVNRLAIPETSFNPTELRKYKTGRLGEDEKENNDDDHNDKQEQNGGTEITEDKGELTTSASFEELLLQTMQENRHSAMTTVSKKRKVAGTAVVLTAADLQAFRSNGETSGAKVRKPVKKKASTSTSGAEESDSEDADEPSVNNSSSDNDLEDQNSDHDDMVREPHAGDYCLVKFKTKKCQRYFVGQILQQDDDRYEVKFLRCYSKNMGKFRWPDEHDICTVILDDIEKILPSPGQERRGFLVFAINFSNYNLS